MIKSQLLYRVLYAHTDMMGVIYYAKYFEYFEAGRNDLLRNLNYPYILLEEKGYALPVIEAHCKFHTAGKYDQLLRIVTMMKEAPTVRLRLDYEIYNEDTLLVSGYTIHTFVNNKSLRPVKPPEDFMVLIKSKF